MKSHYFTYTNKKSGWLINNTVCPWSTNCGLQHNCGSFCAFHWVAQHLLLWAVWYIRT